MKLFIKNVMKNKIFLKKRLTNVALSYIIVFVAKDSGKQLRGVAQMGARVVWDHEVAGSIHVTPTINYQKVLTKC